MKKKTVSVITSSIGRAQLIRTINSVRQQTHPCHHYVFINGKKWWHTEATEQALALSEEHEGLTIFLLPEETGDSGLGPGCGAVFTAAPWLTNSDYIAFLNDDDFYDPEHIESLLSLTEGQHLSWAYSLRRFISPSGEAFCDDNFDSLGFWPCLYGNGTQFLVDQSCYLLRTEIARKHGNAWSTPKVADRILLRDLKNAAYRAGCSGRITLNYQVGLDGSGPGMGHPYFTQNDRIAREKYPQGFPWNKETIFVAKET